MNLEGKWKAIFIGGLIIGLSPFVPLLNFACCIIPLVGSMVAVAIYRNSTPPPQLTNNEGVVLGAMSGLIGTGIYAVLVVPLVLLMGSLVSGIAGRFMPNLVEIPDHVRTLLQGIFSHFGGILAFIVLIKIVSQLAFSLIFGILGGLLGVALFKTRQP